ncbi:MAG: hypothetical protein AB7F12_30190 [Pseudonocardia sp.]
MGGADFARRDTGSTAPTVDRVEARTDAPGAAPASTDAQSTAAAPSTSDTAAPASTPSPATGSTTAPADGPTTNPGDDRAAADAPASAAPASDGPTDGADRPRSGSRDGGERREYRPRQDRPREGGFRRDSGTSRRDGDRRDSRGSWDRDGARPGRGRDDRRDDRRVPRRDDRRDDERTHVPAPPLTDEIAASDLDSDVRRDLRGLQRDTAETVARHLVAAGSLVDDDPQLALEHARYARRRASRIAVVREASGIVAYHAGEWAEALGELRAARRMGGGPGHLAVMADIERALGRPERALEIARGPEVADLDPADRIELAIVAAGARRDMGELDAAVVGLQIAELDPARRDPWSARLFYAHADNLLAAGREADAVQWFVHAHDADAEGETDAAARIAELTGDELGTEDDVTFGEEDYPLDDHSTGDAEPVSDTDDRGHQDADPEDGESDDAQGSPEKPAGVTETSAASGTGPAAEDAATTGDTDVNPAPTTEDQQDGGAP